MVIIGFTDKQVAFINKTNEPWHVISNNVEFWQVKTQTSLCSFLLSLETPNHV